MIAALLYNALASQVATTPDQYLFVHGGVTELPADLGRVIKTDQQGRFKIVEQDGFCIVLDQQSTGITLNLKIAEGLEEIVAGNKQKGLDLIQKQVAPLVLSWILDPATKQSPYSKISRPELTPSYGVSLKSTTGDNLLLRNSAPGSPDQPLFDVTTVLEDKNPQTLGQSLDRLGFVSIGRQLHSEQERSRHNLAIKVYWDTYDQMKSRYNTAMNACMDQLYRDSGIAFNLNRSDRGKHLNELSLDRRDEIRRITGFNTPDDLESATIQRVWKTITVSFSVATPNGSKEGVLFEFLSEMP